MISLDARFSSAEARFLSAVEEGPQALRTFDEELRSLHLNVKEGIDSDTLSTETIQLANAFIDRISLLTKSFLDLQLVAQKVATSEILLHHSDPSSSTPRHSQIPLSHDSILPLDVISPCPPYIAPAYKWLLKNLHNPYPSPETKELISNSTGTSIKHINAWFMNARRRMGWTALSKSLFMGSQKETLDAAHRALVEEDPTLRQDITIAFVELKYKARGLYSEKLKPSVLAGKLNVVVKDMTDEDRERHEKAKEKAAEEAKRQKEMEKELKKRKRAHERAIRKAEKLAQISYPSPGPSQSGSPEPPTLEVCEDGPTLPESVAGHKRRVASQSDTDCEDNADRSNKRARYVAKPRSVWTMLKACADLNAMFLAHRKILSIPVFPRLTHPRRIYWTIRHPFHPKLLLPQIPLHHPIVAKDAYPTAMPKVHTNVLVAKVPCPVHKPLQSPFLNQLRYLNCRNLMTGSSTCLRYPVRQPQKSQIRRPLLTWSFTMVGPFRMAHRLQPAHLFNVSSRPLTFMYLSLRC